MKDQEHIEQIKKRILHLKNVQFTLEHLQEELWTGGISNALDYIKDRILHEKSILGELLVKQEMSK